MHAEVQYLQAIYGVKDRNSSTRHSGFISLVSKFHSANSLSNFIRKVFGTQPFFYFFFPFVVQCELLLQYTVDPGLEERRIYQGLYNGCPA